MTFRVCSSPCLISISARKHISKWMSHGPPLSLLDTLYYYCIVSPVQDYLGSEMGDSFVLALCNSQSNGLEELRCCHRSRWRVGRSIATKHVQFIFHLPIFPAENRKHEFVCGSRSSLLYFSSFAHFCPVLVVALGHVVRVDSTPSHPSLYSRIARGWTHWRKNGINKSWAGQWQKALP